MKRILHYLKKYWTELLFLFPATTYLIGFFFLIFYSLASLSTKGFSSFDNFRYIFNNVPEFSDALLNSVVYVMIGTPLELIAGMSLAILIYRDFRFRGFFRTLFIIPFALPGLVIAAILLILFDMPGGHINEILTGRTALFPQVISNPIDWHSSSFVALGVTMVGKVWRDMPISMLIILSGINAIPKDQYQAAEIMGSSSFRSFRYITLPLLIPAIRTVLVIRSIEMWKEFIFPYVFCKNDYILGTLIEKLFMDDLYGEGWSAALAVILFACIIITVLVIRLVADKLIRRLIRI